MRAVPYAHPVAGICGLWDFLRSVLSVSGSVSVRIFDIEGRWGRMGMASLPTLAQISEMTTAPVIWV